jgi:hypothetical protein
MPMLDYTELSGLSNEDADTLAFEWMKWAGLASSFTVGPDAEAHAARQGIMRLLNKAEEIGIKETG